ncbi:hypothetical protein [Candidatus Spongiihabitans sp.]|uniref:hypothetical protein n=1 Tax=Candidatus Spongiihabitans sp. TaxID=3101308 RepID=UPI003C7A0B08
MSIPYGTSIDHAIRGNIVWNKKSPGAIFRASPAGARIKDDTRKNLHLLWCAAPNAENPALNFAVTVTVATFIATAVAP